MRFVDEVKISLVAGDGGQGCCSFRREKFVDRGGPDGGNGGDGGSIIFEVDAQLVTLMDLHHRRHLRAPAGRPGEGGDRTGASGEDLVVWVPPGTQVLDAESGELIADLTEPGARMPIVEGGVGGRGNASYASSRNRAPRRSDPGRPGEEREVILALKLVADVGLVGFPNVGKSTLISRVSRARPRIAPYPFTTLTPKLGVVSSEDELLRMIIADIPGLVPGAHTGIGLGDRFLRHVERSAAFLHIVAPDGDPDRHPISDLEVLLEELRAYDPELLNKHQLLALNKIDTEDGQAVIEDVAAEAEARGMRFFPVSAQTGEGVEALVAHLLEIAGRDDHTLLANVADGSLDDSE